MAGKITIEKLAGMVKDGFDESDKKSEEANRKLASIDGRLGHMDARLSSIEKDISEIKNRFVYRIEFEDLAAGVKYLESKLKIESGK